MTYTPPDSPTKGSTTSSSLPGNHTLLHRPEELVRHLAVTHRVTLKAFVCSFRQRLHPAAAAAPPAAQAPLAQLCLHLPGWYHDKTHLWQVMAVFRFSHFQRWGSSEQLVGAGWFWSSARGLQGRVLVMAAKLDIMWHGFSREYQTGSISSLNMAMEKQMEYYKNFKKKITIIFYISISWCPLRSWLLD